jgi:hypothetical protein
MPFDIGLDLATGDWIFNSRRDYAGTTGTALVSQRIHVRIFIQRGSYHMGSSETLGSNLRSSLRLPASEVRNSIDMFIREALAPMDDIIIQSIDVKTHDDDRTINPKQVQVRINWVPVQFGQPSEAFITPNQTTVSLAI